MRGRILLPFLILVALTPGCISLRWGFHATYVAHTKVAREALAAKAEELGIGERSGGLVSNVTADRLLPTLPANQKEEAKEIIVSYQWGVASDTADMLVISCPANLRASPALVETRRFIEKILGPELMRLLRVHSEVFPEA